MVIRAIGARQFEPDGHRVLLFRDVREVHVRAAGGDAQGFGNRFRADAGERGLFLVDVKQDALLVFLAIPVDIDHALGVAENLADLGGERLTLRTVAAIDLRDERLQNRRTGRDFRDGDARVVFLRHLRQRRAHAFGDIMTLGIALALGQQVDLDVRHIRTAAQEIMADEAVEVEGRGGAGIDLIVGHLGLGGGGGREFARGLGGAFERRSFRHVEHDLELALVIKRQHFHLHITNGHQRHRT